MNVDHSIAPRLDKTRRQKPHKSSQADKLDPLFVEQLVGLRSKGVPIEVRNDRGPNFSRIRQPETRCCRTITDNESDLRGVCRIAASLNQGLEI